MIRVRRGEHKSPPLFRHCKPLLAAVHKDKRSSQQVSNHDSVCCPDIKSMSAPHHPISYLRVSDSVQRAFTYAHMLCTDAYSGDSDTATIATNIESHLTHLINLYSPGAIEAQAKADAQDFTWPIGMLEHDTTLLKQCGSLRVAIEHKQRAQMPFRFNKIIVDTYLRGDPHYDLLIDIAVNGARVEVPDGFARVTAPHEPRALEGRLGNTFLKHAAALCVKHRGMVVNLIDIPVTEIPEMNYNSNHWVGKPLTPGGRWIIDPVEINTDWATEQAIMRYGKVALPTMAEMFAVWVAYCTVHNVSLHECRIYKDDIKSAFPQLNYSPDSAFLMAVAISTSLVFLSLVGNFGWTGFPMVFSVVAGAILRLCRSRIHGVLFIYVDDFMGFALAKHAKQDKTIVQLTTNCIIPNGIALDKSEEPGLEHVLLGWDVSLTRASMSPSHKGRDKLLLWFFMVDESQQQSHKTWETLASLAEHYSFGIRGARGLVNPLHKMKSMCEATGISFIRKKHHLRLNSALKCGAQSPYFYM